MMQHWVRVGLAGLVTVVLIARVVSLGAQEHDTVLPPLMPVQTMQSNTVWTFDEQPLLVCQAHWESWNRSHEVCHYLTQIPGEIFTVGDSVERVFYDDMLYTRMNDDLTWTVTDNSFYEPGVALIDGFTRVGFEAGLSEIGPLDVAGIPTTHYQYWAVDTTLQAQQDALLVHDLFLSAEHLLIKAQFHRRGLLAGLGEGELASVWVFSAFNSPISVAPPPQEMLNARYINRQHSVFALSHYTR